MHERVARPVSGTSVVTMAPSTGRSHFQHFYPVLALLLGFALLNVFLANIDPQAFAVVLLTPAIPFVVLAVFSGVIGNRRYGAALCIIIIFLLATSFRNRGYLDKGIDLQVALKLCAIVGLFAMSLPFVRRIAREISLSGLVSWLLFFAYTLVTCSYTINPVPALVAVASLLGAFLFACFMRIHFGRSGTLGLIVATGTMLWVGSLAVYVAVPSLGRMNDWVGTDFVETWRLQGLFGSSNSAGMAAACGLLLVVMYLSEPRSSRVLAWAASLSALACLLLSNNRMAMFAFAAALASFYVLDRSFGKRALLLISLMLFGVSLAALFAEELLSLVSRSGSWDEIMSATGRTRIWSVVIALWSQTPVMGRGFGSALYILPTHPDLFLAAAHAHNLYLEQLFSGGLIGLGLFVCSIVTTMVAAWRNKAARECALLLFFLIYGLTEPVISGPVSFAVIIMFLAVVLILSNKETAMTAAPAPTKLRQARAPVTGPTAELL